MTIDNLVYILIAAVIVVLIVSYACAWTMTDSGRLEWKKLAVRKQFDLELAKVGAVEVIKLEEARELMLKAMDRGRSVDASGWKPTVDALLSDRS